MIKDTLEELFPELLSTVSYGECTLDVPTDQLLKVAQVLKDHPACAFEQLIDLCGVDYLHYGVSEWDTTSATAKGYGRAQAAEPLNMTWKNERFAVVVHLSSIKKRQRLRLRIHLKHDDLFIESLTSIWPSASWYEREAYDLFGIAFKGHPDLRRILTDYGFVGYPFRKDFPMIGRVEKRYDASQGKCINEPMKDDPSSVQNRVGVPKVIRRDHRYKDVYERTK